MICYAMRCYAMRCDAMLCDGMPWAGAFFLLDFMLGAMCFNFATFVECVT